MKSKKALLRLPLKLWLKSELGSIPFCIFSNDCYGAEFYKWLNRPYNTPFVGLMLMAPCYIKFLENPKHYLSMQMTFAANSNYKAMNKFRQERGGYPLGKLGDIEIHFLHYANSESALEKWNRRTQRIDWMNIKVKFAMDKDFATPALLTRFEALSFQHKLSISKQFYASPSNIQLKPFHTDAGASFISSLNQIDFKSWMIGEQPQKLVVPKKTILDCLTLPLRKF